MMIGFPGRDASEFQHSATKLQIALWIHTIGCSEIIEQDSIIKHGAFVIAWET